MGILSSSDELKRMKHFSLFILVLIYTVTFFILPIVVENGDEYLILLDRVKNSFSKILFGDSITNTDAYIVNTYYYPKSKSLGDNAVAMILLMNRNTMRDITKYKMKLVASNETTSVEIIPRILVEAYANCAYVNVVAKTNSLPNMNQLEITSDNTYLQISFKSARSVAPAPVIICVSPQFVAEQWQLFVTHAHISRHFGGHLHLYITSIQDAYFHLIKEYEKLGYVTVDFWMRMKFKNTSAESLDPNENTEWRNQAGSHTDCLLQYKEVASFVTFLDLDDILIPRGYDTYHEEFSALSFLNPNFLTFQYPKREIMVHLKSTLGDVNFEEIFGHPWFANEESTGKIVVKPENLDSMWIHRSFQVREKKMKVVNHNFLIHLQKPFEITGHNSVPFAMSKYTILKEFQLNKTIFHPIQKDFGRVLKIPKLRKISKKLPKTLYYFPLMFRCYFEKGYTAECPNGEGCMIPQRSDIKCIHSTAEYKSGPQMNPVTFHYHENPKWSRKIGCSL